MNLNLLHKYFILILLFFTVACKPKSNNIAKPGQGTIVYNITYPDSLKYGLKFRFFPRKITLVFKDEKAAFIASAGFGMIQMVDLLDHKSKSFTSLLIDQMNGNYACRLTPPEIAEAENNPEYVFKPTDEKKNIAGQLCTKGIINDLTNKTTFEIYYCEKLRFYYWNSPFKNINYLFLEYEHSINNLKMKLVATQVDFSTPVDTTLFEVKGSYNWVNQKDFLNHLNQL